MGIRQRFVIVAGVLGALAMLVIGISSYMLSLQSAKAEARSKGQIIFNYIKSSNTYFKLNQRPLITELVEEDRFYPELMSTFAITRGIYETFAKVNPDVKFKQATLNPLLPSNKADEDEKGIIAYFRDNPQVAEQEGQLNKAGVEFFYLAQPVKVDSPDCLTCHGDPYEAPKDQVEIYGDESGYNWKMNDIVGAVVVYVPIKEAMASAKRSAGFLFMIGAGCLIVALLGIWVYLDRGVVGPIVQLSSRAEEISTGKNLEEKIETSSQDEIGSLIRSVERLRVSMSKMLKRRKG